ncbi:MAG: NINE protein [Muribaculaceae bacterium]|nr:NINE protein [Muribaculaceae bacterium]
MMYYITFNGNCVGPMTASQVAAYKVNENTPVSVDGVNWSPLYNYPELMGMINGASNNAVDNKKLIAGICAIIVGTLGVQYFILDKPVAGVITILLSIVTCGLWGIVTLIQGIMMLMMTDEEFERKYVYSTSTFPIF